MHPKFNLQHTHLTGLYFSEVIRVPNEAGQTFTATESNVTFWTYPYPHLYNSSQSTWLPWVLERERERSNHGNIGQKTLNMIYRMNIKISTKIQDIILIWNTYTCCNAKIFFFLDFWEGHPNIIPPTESHGYGSLVLHFLTNNHELLLTKVTAVISIYI